MSVRKFFVIGVIVSYALLIGLSLHYEREEQRDKPDFFSSDSLFNPPVRFCCRNVTTCNEKFIRENFVDATFRNHNRSLDLSEYTSFQPVLSAPKCTLLEKDFEEASVVSKGWMSKFLIIVMSHHHRRHIHFSLMENFSTRPKPASRMRFKTGNSSGSCKFAPHTTFETFLNTYVTIESTIYKVAVMTYGCFIHSFCYFDSILIGVNIRLCSSQRSAIRNYGENSATCVHLVFDYLHSFNDNDDIWVKAIAHPAWFCCYILVCSVFSSVEHFKHRHLADV